MAVIQSGDSTDILIIDETSKAARTTDYDTRGNNRGTKATYRASSAVRFVASAGTDPFFLMYGSSTKTIIVQRLIVGTVTLTADEFIVINAVKYSTVQNGGTSTSLVQVPVDSTDGSGTLSSCKYYTAAPTVGTLVGVLESQTVFGCASGTPVLASPSLVFDFRTKGSENTGIYLRGVTEGIGLLFASAPGSASSLSITVEWTEE